MSNRENVLKWVEALESDEYNQCQGRLKDPESDSYCCLGVATEVFMHNNPGILQREVTDYNETGDGKAVTYYPAGYPSSQEGSSVSLPMPVAEWLGIDSVPRIDTVSRQGKAGDTDIWWLNDGLDLPFWKIAQYIRRDYLGEEISEPDLVY